YTARRGEVVRDLFLEAVRQGRYTLVKDLLRHEMKAICLERNDDEAKPHEPTPLHKQQPQQGAGAGAAAGAGAGAGGSQHPQPQPGAGHNMDVKHAGAAVAAGSLSAAGVGAAAGSSNPMLSGNNPMARGGSSMRIEQLASRTASQSKIDISGGGP